MKKTIISLVSSVFLFLATIAVVPLAATAFIAWDASGGRSFPLCLIAFALVVAFILSRMDAKTSIERKAKFFARGVICTVFLASCALNFFFVKMGNNVAVIERSNGSLTAVEEKYDYAFLVPFRDKVTLFNEKVRLTADCAPIHLKKPGIQDGYKNNSGVSASIETTGFLTPDTQTRHNIYYGDRHFSWTDIYREHHNQETLEENAAKRLCTIFANMAETTIQVGIGKDTDNKEDTGPYFRWSDEYFAYRPITAKIILHLDKKAPVSQ